MSETPITGTCLCKGVQFQLTGHLGIFQYCHCSRCRKFTGSTFSSNLLVLPEQFSWLRGEALVGRYELAEAKYFATGFCTRCGSSLPWLSQSGKVVIVPAGTLDSDPGIRPSQNIFCGSRAVWYQSPETLATYEDMPPRTR
ncbi:MAG: GFA family protein [Gammaproteobacteria bacterium]|nr:GFA family protein [Gammaproteobacteria bacterium]